MSTYRIEKPYPGKCNIIDTEDGRQVARVGTFMPGPMVRVVTQEIITPDMARTLAEALIVVSGEIERGEY